jgi:hypothetical protein
MTGGEPSAIGVVGAPKTNVSMRCTNHRVRDTWLAESFWPHLHTASTSRAPQNTGVSVKHTCNAPVCSRFGGTSVTGPPNMWTGHHFTCKCTRGALRMTTGHHACPNVNARGVLLCSIRCSVKAERPHPVHNGHAASIMLRLPDDEHLSLTKTVRRCAGQPASAPALQPVGVFGAVDGGGRILGQHGCTTCKVRGGSSGRRCTRTPACRHKSARPQQLMDDGRVALDETSAKTGKAAHARQPNRVKCNTHLYTPHCSTPPQHAYSTWQ